MPAGKSSKHAVTHFWKPVSAARRHGRYHIAVGIYRDSKEYVIVRQVAPGVGVDAGPQSSSRSSNLKVGLGNRPTAHGSYPDVDPDSRCRSKRESRAL